MQYIYNMHNIYIYINNIYIYLFIQTQLEGAEKNDGWFPCFNCFSGFDRPNNIQQSWFSDPKMAKIQRQESFNPPEITEIAKRPVHPQ